MGDLLTWINIPLNRSQDESYISFSVIIYVLSFVLIVFAVFAFIWTVIRKNKAEYKNYFLMSALFLAPCFLNFREGPFNLLAFDYLARTLLLISILMAILGCMVCFFGKK